MTVTVDLPEDLARSLAGNPADLERAVLEGLALEGVRSGRLTVGQGRRLLGIASRDEMDGFLKAHGVYLETSIEDLERDVAMAAKFRSQ